mmetsp:Transcript_68353/g.134185  ORF Transcript_68353/g.134185 Transcript_68353/m.134185 type:complete len:393 (-) Transcript_68353:76-1254(-)
MKQTPSLPLWPQPPLLLLALCTLRLRLSSSTAPTRPPRFRLRCKDRRCPSCATLSSPQLPPPLSPLPPLLRRLTPRATPSTATTTTTMATALLSVPPLVLRLFLPRPPLTRFHGPLSLTLGILATKGGKWRGCRSGVTANRTTRVATTRRALTEVPTAKKKKKEAKGKRATKVGLRKIFATKKVTRDAWHRLHHHRHRRRRRHRQQHQHQQELPSPIACGVQLSSLLRFTPPRASRALSMPRTNRARRMVEAVTGRRRRQRRRRELTAMAASAKAKAVGRRCRCGAKLFSGSPNLPLSLPLQCRQKAEKRQLLQLRPTESREEEEDLCASTACSPATRPSFAQTPKRPKRQWHRHPCRKQMAAKAPKKRSPSPSMPEVTVQRTVKVLVVTIT